MALTNWTTLYSDRATRSCNVTKKNTTWLDLLWLYILAFWQWYFGIWYVVPHGIMSYLALYPLVFWHIWLYIHWYFDTTGVLYNWYFGIGILCSGVFTYGIMAMALWQWHYGNGILSQWHFGHGIMAGYLLLSFFARIHRLWVMWAFKMSYNSTRTFPNFDDHPSIVTCILYEKTHF